MDKDTKATKATKLLNRIRTQYQLTTIPISGYKVPEGTTMEWIKDEWLLSLADFRAAGYTEHEITKFAIIHIKAELQWQIMQSYNM